jgi:Insertion element 4 transposase N-terminal/Transposase DDE domain
VINTSAGGEKVVVARLTDVIGIGVLTRLVTRELVDDVLLRTRRKEVRQRGLPARVVVYFVLALALFSRDSYEEVMRKLIQGLRSILIVKKDWKVPTSSAFSKARVRLGIEPIREIFDMVTVPCAMRSTPGAWKRGYRLMALDGVEVDAPDSPENAAHFGYSGVKKKDKSAFVKIPALALAECGTHAIVDAEIGTDADSEHTLADRLVSSTDKLQADMLVLTDRGLHSHNLLTKITAAGASACMRVTATLDLPVIRWLPDGSFLSYIPDPEEKKKARAALADTRISVTDIPGTYVRVVEYEVPNRGDAGKRELFTLITDITDHTQMTSVDLAEAYHERWEIELTFDEIETHQRGGAVILRSKLPDLVVQELYGYLITHYATRQIMAEAADQAEIDPDRLSFTRSLNVIRRQVTSQAAFSPSKSESSNRRNHQRDQ